MRVRSQKLIHWSRKHAKKRSFLKSFHKRASLKSGIPEMCHLKSRIPEMGHLNSGVPEFQWQMTNDHQLQPSSDSAVLIVFSKHKQEAIYWKDNIRCQSEVQGIPGSRYSNKNRPTQTLSFLSFDKSSQHLAPCHFCVFEDCKVLPFCPKVEDLSRHPSIFKPHEGLGAKPKGFGKNVKMCVCVFMFVCLWVYICALHMRLCLTVQVTNHCHVFHILRCNSSCLGSRGYGIEL